MELFFTHVHLHGGPAPVRCFLLDLMDRVWNRQIQPGKVFDSELSLDGAAEDIGRWTPGGPSRFSCAPDRLVSGKGRAR
jgi:hypothetical protein